MFRTSGFEGTSEGKPAPATFLQIAFGVAATTRAIAAEAICPFHPALSWRAAFAGRFSSAGRGADAATTKWPCTASLRASCARAPLR